MRSFMTKYTHRYDIERMFLGVAQIVVVFFGLSGAFAAFQGFYWRDISPLYRVIHFIAGLVMIWVFKALLCITLMLSNSPFFSLVIFCVVFFMHCFTLWALLVSPVTIFTPTLKPGFCDFILTKPRGRLNFLTFGALFCYAILLHDCYSSNQLCSGRRGPIPAAVLLNITPFKDLSMKTSPLLALILTCIALTGCTTFTIKGPDGTEVRATTFITDFDSVEGIFPDGSSFSIEGAKTQVEAAVDAGIKVAGAIVDAREEKTVLIPR